jgi:hypothetical protein
MVFAWFVSSVLTGTGVQASPPEDDVELKALFDQDQADRRTSGGSLEELLARAKRDEERLARVKELYVAGVPRTGADWFHAALVLQHAQEADDILLAHEMALASIAAGDPRARWLAAATEDRFLRRIGRSQRFGTQYESTEGPPTLAETATGVTDHLREALSVPPLPEPGAELGRQ